MTQTSSLEDRNAIRRCRVAANTDGIPVLDIGPFLQGEAGVLGRLAGELRSVREEVSFYYIVNHDAPQALFDRCFDELRRFFALPFEEKIKLRVDCGMVG